MFKELCKAYLYKTMKKRFHILVLFRKEVPIIQMKPKKASSKTSMPNPLSFLHTHL